MSAYGEMLPNPDNRVELHPTLKDVFGIPALRIECSHGPVEIARAVAEREALLELARSLEVAVSHVDPAPAPPGLANHECGTARMGRRPEDSVADPNNECWEARGLYLVDGACLPSQGTQNPTMTYLALTARACAHAIGAGSR
jgi:choline dehydrogenase-like flavoprotein